MVFKMGIKVTNSKMSTIKNWLILFIKN
jgi:hypothetical protein